MSFDRAAELKKFEEGLEKERAALLAAQARRRADLVRQLKEEHQNEPEFTHRAMIPRAVSPSIGCGTAGTQSAGRESKCGGCSKQGSCSSAKQQEERSAAEIAQRMSGVLHRVIVASTKGGVGKSTMASQLAFALAARGFSVGLLDVDICGATVPKMIGRRGEGVMRGENGLVPVRVGDKIRAMSIGFLVEDENEAVIWRGPRKQGIIQMMLRDVDWGDVDFLIVDTPPGTSDEHLGTVQMLKATGIDGAVVVTTPQDVAVVEVGKEIDFCRRVDVPIIGVVENFSELVCPLCQGVTKVWPATSGGGRWLAENRKVPFLGSVPLDPALSRFGEVGGSLSEDSPTGKVVYNIADQVIAAVGALPSQ